MREGAVPIRQIAVELLQELRLQDQEFAKVKVKAELANQVV